MVKERKSYYPSEAHLQEKAALIARLSVVERQIAKMCEELGKEISDIKHDLEKKND